VRVIFVTHNYPRSAGDLPGAFLHPLAVALVARGHDVRVVAPSDRGQGGREPLDGVPVRRVRYASPERETLAYGGRMQEAVRSLKGLLALRRLVRALRVGARAEALDADQPVVTHAHWWFPAGLSAPTEIPLVVTLHGTDGRLLERSALARRLGRRVLEDARIVTAVSADLARTVAMRVGREDVLTRIQPMAVDASGRPWTRGGGGAMVVGRLTAQKRVDLAILAVAELERSGQAVPLTIIGDGPERAVLERLAGSVLRQTAARFTGLLGAQEVAGALATADVLLFPSIGEGFGLSALEALMAGVPVVACSDGGGVVAAVREHGGGIVTDPSPAAIADGILAAQSPACLAAARSAGVQWRELLAPGRVAERFEGWYREAVDPSDSRKRGARS
jgi:glycosyltransferase involved in cell wall biosynthesis